VILLIDNYDSFTWNLVQRLGEIDRALEVRVVRNDRITAAEAMALRPSHIIISPGPCTPNEAGVSSELVQEAAGRVPVLGVCLGHQCMGQVNGMVVERHTRIVHGKTSPIAHDGRGVFRGLPDPFLATRYHSLVVRRDTVPVDGSWEVSATTTDTLDDGTTVEVVMGLRRRAEPGEAPAEGVQFHPESFLTEAGPALLRNFLECGRR
jgi:anthranilate synthase/aminodeoxychorismate synthase-like glutamine amidotransferase